MSSNESGLVVEKVLLVQVGKNNAFDHEEQVGLTTLTLLKSSFLETKTKIGRGGQAYRFFHLS